MGLEMLNVAIVIFFLLCARTHVCGELMQSDW